MGYSLESGLLPGPFPLSRVFPRYANSMQTWHDLCREYVYDLIRGETIGCRRRQSAFELDTSRMPVRGSTH